IDELLDTLVLNQPRTAGELRDELAHLCRGAADPDPILHSFKDKELLRIGVRDILGKDTVVQTTADLSDLAETILRQIAELQYPPLARRMGVPMGGVSSDASGEREHRPLTGLGSPSATRFVLLGLGKLGGKEMSYHSDLDLILIYEADGWTVPPEGS